MVVRETQNRTCAQHGVSVLETSGLDFAVTLVTRENDASGANNAFRHLERRRDRALAKQLFPLTQGDRIDHQPEGIDQIILHERLQKIAAAPYVQIWAIPLLDLGDFFRNIAA